MDVTIKPGTYVVAVSGGVDSMALLHMLQQKSDLKIVVAHFDHGIRDDSEQDRKLIQDVLSPHQIPFVYEQGKLGTDTSEEKARKARYAFLHRVRQASGAKAIITAHHQDDLLETAIHNMFRGTGRRGMVSMRSREHVRRPLLNLTKSQLIEYAEKNNLAWREDSTNTDTKYRRNYIRHHIVPKLSEEHKSALMNHIYDLQKVDEQLERELTNHLHLHPGVSELDRYWFIMLPHEVAREVLYVWLRRHAVSDITSPMLERLIVAAKTYAPNKQAIIDQRTRIDIYKKTLEIRVSGP